jgi:hypothetical protein
VLRSQRALEVGEEILKTYRALDRLVAAQADRGATTPSVALQARAALAKATSDALSARYEFVALGPAAQSSDGAGSGGRLRLSAGPRATPAAAIRMGVTAGGQ